MKTIILILFPIAMFAQCDSIPVIMDAQGGFNYQWCSEEWNGQQPDCFDISCPLLNPCQYQTVCFTLQATTTLPYIFTLQSDIGNQWLDDGVNCTFFLMDQYCEEIYISPCWNNWNQDQDYITVDWFEGSEQNTPYPWTCCSGANWELTVQLPLGTYNFCVSPSIHPENEGEGCMDLTIFAPPILGLNIEEYKQTGYFINRATAIKLKWLGW